MSATKKTGFFNASTLAPTPYDAELKHARAAVLEAVEGRGWQAHGTTDGVELFTNPTSPFPATRGITVVKAHPLLIHTLFGDAQHRKSWDPMIEETRLLDRVDRLTHIGCSTFKTMWPVARRDMLIVGRGERNLTTGAYLTYGTSITHTPTPHPPTHKGTVRAHLLYFGTLITPLSGADTGKCRVVFVACSDPKGSLPNVLVAAAGKLQPLNINRVVAFSVKAGIREETERKLMEAIGKEGFDEEEGRFSEKTAAPPAAAAAAAASHSDSEADKSATEATEAAKDDDKRVDAEEKEKQSESDSENHGDAVTKTALSDGDGVAE